MILQSGYDCWLTQSGDVPSNERVFLNSTVVSSADDFAKWKEITSRQKDEMVAMNALLDTSNMDYKTISKAEDVIRKVQENIKEHINSAELTDNEALDKKDWFPSWEQVQGVEIPAGFKLTFEGTLYEATERHTVNRDDKPGSSGLYKEVTETVYGTKENPYKYERGMTLEKGKYYTEYGAVYLCVRDNVQAYGADLPRLASGGYVSLVDDEPQPPEAKGDEPQPPEAGSKENPIEWAKGMKTEKGKYYLYEKDLYLCVQDDDGGADWEEIVEKKIVEKDGGNSDDKEAEGSPMDKEAEGSFDNPIKYEKGTPLEEGKHYVEDGLIYLCVLSAAPSDKELKELNNYVKLIEK